MLRGLSLVLDEETLAHAARPAVQHTEPASELLVEIRAPCRVRGAARQSKTVLLADLPKQPAAGSATQLEYLIEARIIAVVRIGNGGARCCGGVERAHQPKLFSSLGTRREPPEIGQIRRVHGDNSLETIEISNAKLPRSARHVDSSASAGRSSSAVRRFAAVMTGGAGTIDFKARRQPCGVHQMSKDALSRWGSANVA